MALKPVGNVRLLVAWPVVVDEGNTDCRQELTAGCIQNGTVADSRHKWPGLGRSDFHADTEGSAGAGR